MTIDFQNIDGLNYLSSLTNNSIDLILTDPPYITSRESGMDSHFNNIQNNQNNIQNGLLARTEDDWKEWVGEKVESFSDIQKKNFLTYGTIYGKKYAVKTNYGEWDKTFTMDLLEQFIKLFYQKLRDGGTCIIFFDIWKITDLRNLLEKYKFKQIRFIEWIKTNPQPLNSKLNYLTNCREIALTAVKKGKPTFNSAYDNGIYSFPIQGGKIRTHPTQKNLNLFKELIMKHSNEGDLVVDPFLGSGTSLFACEETGRNFQGSELDLSFYETIEKSLKLREQNK